MYFAVFRYFTYYEKEIPEHLKATNSCLLVGWNLRQACFNLEKACVMMKECRVLDETCKTCQVFNAISVKMSIMYIIDLKYKFRSVNYLPYILDGSSAAI